MAKLTLKVRSKGPKPVFFLGSGTRQVLPAPGRDLRAPTTQGPPSRHFRDIRRGLIPAGQHLLPPRPL